MVYLSILVLIASIASISYRSPVDVVNGLNSNANALVYGDISMPSVDQLAVADLAAQTAEIAGLSVASEVSSMSITLNAQSKLSQLDESVIAKPQIFEPTSSSALSSYRTVVGDNVPSIAGRFGISAETLRWANNLVGDTVAPNVDLVVPSVDGVIYTTKDGDTVDSIAERYKSDKSRIISKNDLELTGIVAGQRIVLPGGVLPENERPGYVAPRISTSTYSSYSAPVNSYYAVQSGNRYSYGYCTWYVYNRRAEIGRPIGSLWGNASSWAYMAGLAGFTVNHTPEPGAVMQNGGGLGHVAFVERVDPDGSVYITEMNYAGWNIVSSRTLTAGEASGYNFIH